MTTTAHEIVARRRREDQRRDFEWAIDRLTDAESEIVGLLGELEEREQGLTVADVQKRIGQAAGPLIRALPVLRRFLVGEDAI